MSILSELSSTQGRKDEVPNQELAQKIANNGDTDAIQELIDNLSNKSKGIQNDCIKVLYEIGECEPGLISTYSDTFLELLNSKNNRLQWGGMTALACITPVVPGRIHSFIPSILDAAEKGSVITRDQAIHILIALASISDYTEDMLSLLAEQLLSCPVNQLAMYAERIQPVINESNKERFITILQERYYGLEKESRKKRIAKVIKKLS